MLNAVPGASEVQVQSPPGLPQISIRLRKADLERWGLNAVDVLDIVRAAYQGDVVGQTYEAWAPLLFDDGPADDTAQVACGYADPRVR